MHVSIIILKPVVIYLSVVSVSELLHFLMFDSLMLLRNLPLHLALLWLPTIASSLDALGSSPKHYCDVIESLTDSAPQFLS